MGNSTEFLFNPQIIAVLVFIRKLYNNCRTHLSNYIQFYILLKNLGYFAEPAEYLWPVLLLQVRKYTEKLIFRNNYIHLFRLIRNLHRWAHKVFGASIVQLNGSSWSRDAYFWLSSMYHRGHIIKQLRNLKLGLITAMNKPTLHE